MPRTQTIKVVVACAAALLALAGCSGGSGAAAGPAESVREDAPAGPGKAEFEPPWPGPVLPGLADEPAWSIPRGGEAGSRPDQVKVVGNAVVVLQPLSTTQDGGRSYRAAFHDIVTRQVRATVELAGAVSVETWRGQAALVVRDERTVPASGLTAARDALVVTAFDENGRRLGAADLTKGDLDTQETVLDGWVIRSGPGSDGKSHVWARAADAPAPGTMLHTCESGDSKACVNAVKTSGSSSAFAAQTLFVTEPDQANDVQNLRAVDPVTGRTRWSTATVQAPEGVPTVEQVKGKTPERRAVVLGAVGDKVVLGWYGHDSAATYVGGPVILGLYDAATGRLVSTGPAPVTDSVDGAYLHADASMLYLSLPDLSLAWNTATGATVWQQGEGERPLRVFAVVNDVAYAGVDTSANMDKREQVTASIVINARTKAVLAEPGPSRGMIPQVAANGHAAAETEDRIWIFAPQPPAR